ncbi:MAG: amidohydrolase family protein [Gemmataceae bacterium]
MADEYTVTASYVFPVTSEPLERGTLTVRDGRIVAVEPYGRRRPDHEFGDAAILPGFVNAHTHLDLTGAKNRIPPTSDFLGWLRRVIAYRRERTPEQVADDIRVGIAESLHHGTTSIGDIASGGASWSSLAGSQLRSTVYYELLGLSEQRALAAWTAFESWRPPATTTCRPGVSPHAPYSVHKQLFERSVFVPMPAAIHVAESAEESLLLEQLAGPFVNFLRDLGVYDPTGLARSFRQILAAKGFGFPMSLVHCNYLSPVPFAKHVTVVYCPRTHAAFGHPPHPIREFLALGVRVALGTDSLASNPDLSILAEARFVRERYPDFDGPALLQMATLAGAEALGWADECGSLEPGKSADFAVVELPQRNARDPHDLLFASDRPVRSTVVRGNVVAGNW